jgi:predicted metal-binding membrane protein
MRLRTGSTTTLAALLLLVAAAWAISVRRMTGMEMGMGLGSLSAFIVTWTAMMAAMMVPSALPAALELDGLAPLRFTASYVAVWGIAGFAAYAAYRGIHAGGAAVVLAAAAYELTPLKRRCLAGCRDGVRTDANGLAAGVRYGVHCVGCSAGLMLVLLALGAMSVTWMLVVAALVLVEKVPRFGASLAGPVALLLAGLAATTLTM